MAWIESHQGLSAHPKTKKLMRRLKVPGPVIVGHLHYLWWWALDFAQDGEITQYDHFDIADACEWKGDANDFYEALIHSGFIDKQHDRYFIHDWHDYAGKLIEIRKKDADRKKKAREKGKVSSGSPEDVQWTSSGHPTDSEGQRTESIRDLDLDLDLKESTTTATTSEAISEIRKGSAQLAVGSAPVPIENPFRLFESEGFGTLSATIGEKLGDFIDTYGERWVCEAMKDAAYHQKRSLPYVRSILERYRISGVDEPWTVEKDKVTYLNRRSKGPNTYYEVPSEHEARQAARMAELRKNEQPMKYEPII